MWSTGRLFNTHKTLPGRLPMRKVGLSKDSSTMDECKTCNNLILEDYGSCWCGEIPWEHLVKSAQDGCNVCNLLHRGVLVKTDSDITANAEKLVLRRFGKGQPLSVNVWASNEEIRGPSRELQFYTLQGNSWFGIYYGYMAMPEKKKKKTNT